VFSSVEAGNMHKSIGASNEGCESTEAFLRFGTGVCQPEMSVPCKRNYAAAAATLRTEKEIITRERPLTSMLAPTSVPIAQAELAGHCK